MTEPTIRFDDGAAYERAMGAWSQLAGDVFLDWLAPAAGLQWLDVGCGNGAFTELIMKRCAPAGVQGVDPSAAQLEFARSRAGARNAMFQIGDAMALPYDGQKFDAAVMALVIFFVPQPAQGVAEMARVVRPGGLVSAYAWDILGGGLPSEPIHAELRALGLNPARPPSVAAADIDALRAVWTDAGLESIETRQITVPRTFVDFEDYWAANTAMGNTRLSLEAMPAEDVSAIKTRLRARLPAADGLGRITCSSRANAVKGRVRLG